MLIKVGDMVNTAHGVAKIKCIDEVRHGDKYGHECLEANIGDVDSDRRFRYVIDLDNGHWCRGTQIKCLVHRDGFLR